MSSVFTRSKFEQNVALKLGYEWKNIYRVLTYNDKQNEGACSLKYFDLICQKHNVHLSNNDLTKLMKSSPRRWTSMATPLVSMSK